MSNLSIDHHFLYGLLLFGQLITVIGGLYLAYDLFGRPGGLLRHVTRLTLDTSFAVTVAVVGYLVLYVIFIRSNAQIVVTYGNATTLAALVGLGVGIGLGAGIGYVFNEHSQYTYVPRSPRRRIWYGILIGLEVGGFGCGFDLLVAGGAGRHITWTAALLVGFTYNLLNGYVSATAVTRLLLRRFKSVPESIPDFDRVGFAAGMLGGFILGSLAAIGFWIAVRPALLTAVLFVLSGSIIAAIGGGCIVGLGQRLEWRIEHLPERRLGLFGMFLVLAGFAIQSVNELVYLLDIKVH